MNKINNKQRGFTLIEIVVGIVVLAVALTIVTGVFLPQANKMTTPMYQIKATALGKSIMNQVLIRYYDENNLLLGNYNPCIVCTDPSKYGADAGEDKSAPNGDNKFIAFNDIDDYHEYCNSDPQTTLKLFTSEYPGYGLNICVSSVPKKFGGTAGDNSVAKRITMNIFMPNNESITLTSFKGNY